MLKPFISCQGLIFLFTSRLYSYMLVLKEHLKYQMIIINLGFFFILINTFYCCFDELFLLLHL